jgi:hypothetical protein
VLPGLHAKGAVAADAELVAATPIPRTRPVVPKTAIPLFMFREGFTKADELAFNVLALIGGPFEASCFLGVLVCIFFRIPFPETPRIEVRLTKLGGKRGANSVYGQTMATISRNIDIIESFVCFQEL